MRSIPILALAGPALSQGAPLCYPRHIFTDTLATNFHESPVARLLLSTGAAMEIFASVDGATATVIIVQPNGMSCLLETGEAFSFITGANAVKPGSAT